MGCAHQKGGPSARSYGGGGIGRGGGEGPEGVGEVASEHGVDMLHKRVEPDHWEVGG